MSEQDRYIALAALYRDQHIELSMDLHGAAFTDAGFTEAQAEVIFEYVSSMVASMVAARLSQEADSE